ncbi:hypothetical protein VKT23_010242 [Stygiomarasmius scandens]|uniref:Uncharacterized protein n=1 Tax=Marasmiellus scandens TaxID=2682957 RepID=A0ABR1JCE8_9AGAR
MLSRQSRTNAAARNRQNGGNHMKQTSSTDAPLSSSPLISSSLQFLPSSLTGMVQKPQRSDPPTVPESLRPRTSIRRNTPDHSFTASGTDSNPAPGPTTNATPIDAPRLRSARNLWQPLRRSSSHASSNSQQSANQTSGKDSSLSTEQTLAEELDQMLLDSSEHEKSESGNLGQIDKLQQELQNAYQEQERLAKSLEGMRNERDRLQRDLEASLRGREHLEENLRDGEMEIQKLNEEKEEFKRSLFELSQKLEVMEDIIQEEAEQAKKEAESEKRGLEEAKRDVEVRAGSLLEEKAQLERERDALHADLQNMREDIGRIIKETNADREELEVLRERLKTSTKEREQIEEDRNRLVAEKAGIEEERMTLERTKKTAEMRNQALETELANELKGRYNLEDSERRAHESQVMAESRALEERRARVRVEEELKGMESRMQEVIQQLEFDMSQTRQAGREMNRPGVTGANESQMLVRARDVAQSWNKTAESTWQSVYTRFQGIQTMLPGGGQTSIARFWATTGQSTGTSMVKNGSQRDKILASVRNAEEEVKRATITLNEAIRRLDVVEKQAEKEGVN